jgi:hypothetical protein
VAAPVVDTTFAGENKPPAAKPPTALAVAPPTGQLGIVRPVVSVDDALDAWKQFQTIKAKLLTDADIQTSQDRKYTKKSGWRKIATVFNLSDEIVKEERVDQGKGKDGAVDREFLWRVTVKVVAPNGRYTTGVGTCSTLERFDKPARHFSHYENDVYGTAHTRAKNRGISDLVGSGEVSAEEVE